MNKRKIKEIIREIELFAPLSYQESYDNCGLQVGDPEQETSAALLSLDVTEAVLDEAVALNCNLIIAHHPLLFSGLKSITGKTYVERVVLKAIRHNIAIYAAHTNLDNVFHGVNNKIADKLNLHDRRILAPVQNNLLQLHTYVPADAFEKVRESLFCAGAGHIGNYSECSYSWEGSGTFRPGEGSNPAIGQSGGDRETVKELRLEVILPEVIKNRVLAALRQSHPYEEIAYGFVRLDNESQYVGAGITGELEQAMDIQDFLELLKEKMNTKCIRYTQPHRQQVQRIAVCGGSGSFLLPLALQGKADVFVTGDFKYHQFFDAENKIMIADIGHYESEQFTIEIFSEIIKKKFPNFATLFTKTNTNPVNYYS